MNNPIKLNQDNLSQLPPDVVRPTYDRSRLTTGIVHVGVGGFHRAHEAFYTDLLLQSEDVSQWGICGVGLREADRRMATILKEQDYLYTLIVKHPDGNVETKVIGSIVDFLLGCDDPTSVIDRMADPATKIVSLTITEGGYNVDVETGEFDISNPDAQHDVENPSTPRLVFGYLTAALKKRREAGLPAFTVQSCDNVQHNGDLIRKMLVAFARLQDADLAEWIDKEVCFPNAMVDRIAPVTSESDIEYLRTEFNLDDQWPAVCEPFHQWVIEDSFCVGRPDWQNYGAQFVDDVKPYEEMKLRLLNAGHSVLGILGSVFGYQTIGECVHDELFREYLRKFFDIEATPVLDAVEGIDLDAYKATLIERFGNPSIRDNLARICLESSSKLPVFLIPTLRKNLASGGSIRYAALVIAAWCYYSDKHADRHGQPLEVTDALKDELHEAAKATSKDRLSFLNVKQVFGDLASESRFTKVYAEMIDRVYGTPDVREHMQAILRDPITP
ncbi:mannitol dehydrogenase family protein [Rhodopirellula sp. SWK7]|uniref:mannitol dehydrogenase family protein n=1 Tax=Rhodopirellula sp. SWK7 TaxID=595460 RepID=UPI0002BE5A5E|nr:mannitol dehydrogenase family protein [Rhodopirellula sp. SWK7]EMI46908.1 mannitol dehydrogenase domain protein [Rhodopirellula sp. SWK7]